jgi:hypothetical protein
MPSRKDEVIGNGSGHLEDVGTGGFDGIGKTAELLESSAGGRSPRSLAEDRVVIRSGLPDRLTTRERLLERIFLALELWKRM